MLLGEGSHRPDNHVSESAEANTFLKSSIPMSLTLLEAPGRLQLLGQPYTSAALAIYFAPRSLTSPLQHRLGTSLLKALLSRTVPHYDRTILRDAWGKPYLALHSNVSVSVTHSTLGVAVALAIGHQVGIDMEPKTRREASAAIDAAIRSLNFFSDYDFYLLKHQMSSVQLWTLIEALVKADGRGLHRADQHVEVFSTSSNQTKLRYGAANAIVYQINTSSSVFSVCLMQPKI